MSSPPIQNGNVEVVDVAPKKTTQKKMTVEKIYQKKTQLEHILLRPDTYIGSVEPVSEAMWVYNSETSAMERREITYVPGLYKIFDEILVNAADNKQRDNKMDCIKIEIEKETNTISVWNNGKGIPIVEHKDEKMYVPTMIFGHLLTSSNYNDEEEKVTGGRNGYGAKLCNIFSKKFIVETASSDDYTCFRQTWIDNMSKTSEPKIKPYTSSKDYTKVTFCPDLAKFKMTELDKDIIDLMSRRAYDVAASTGVAVHLNGKKLAVKSFRDYINMYIGDKEDETGKPLKVSYERVNERWEVAVTHSDGGFQQISFVNSIATTKGGRHVDHVGDCLVKQILGTINKKNKGGLKVKPFQVKNHMWIFINCLIVNPTFDSQTKENMTLQYKNFGSKCTLSDKFIQQVCKSGIVESVLTWAKFKEDALLQKATSGKKKNKITGIPKLEDANNAGTNKSMGCTLILTEGDSAKTLAVSGLGVIGRNDYGVFPLRGKLLNVREASHKQIMDNVEINHLIKIMGLEYKRKYESLEDLKKLRYGKLMIMTDQDQDGSHIKGLLINFIHHNWPTLLKLPFLEEFITPIVKATKGNRVSCFYSLPEFEEWKQENENWHTYKIKYYKGLGTSTSNEAKEYFSDMARHRITFNYSGPNDDLNITMAFSKKCVEQRKEWLTQWMETTKHRREMGLAEQYLYEKGTTAVNYSDFVNKELVLFSNSDNERSIPCMVDGLKPGQRKVLFTCLKRNDKREVKVAQLAGSVAEHSAYHHGEASLMGTIINLAQNFVGSNNINILQPIGQFGTRLTGGKDAASPRYIFTMLSPLARLIFHPHDDPLLKHQFDDNQKIEPVWYIPIIPMILVNGADGIGTGWMTKIPNYNPREIVSNLKRLLDGQEPLPMQPWYKNFRGTIETVGTRILTFGEVALLSDDSFEITELPIGTWTNSYKESVLEPLNGDGKSPGAISEYKEHSTDTTVRYVVTMDPGKLREAEDGGLHKFLKLQSTMSLGSMCAFDDNGCLQRYETVSKILKDFYKLRLTYYEKRKAYLEGMLQAESSKLSNQARFIMEKCNGELTVENKKRKVMVEELQKRNYDPDPVRAWKLKQNKEETLADEAEDADSQAEEESEEASEADAKNRYDYLLGMPMWSLTLERKNELMKKRDEKMKEYENIKTKSPANFWREDMDEFLVKLEEVEEKEKREEETSIVKAKKQSVVKKGANFRAKKDLGQETKPSPMGSRVAPKVDSDLVKKFEKIDGSKLKVVKAKKLKREEGEGDADKDDLDNISEKPVKSLKDRLKISPENVEKKLQTKRKALKQTKLGFKPKSPSPRKRKSATGSDSCEDSEGSSDDFKVRPSIRTREAPRRQAASKVKFTYSDEELSDTEPDKFVDIVEEAPNPNVIQVSDTDSEFEPGEPEKSKQGVGNSDAMFDSLLSGGKSSDGQNDSSPEKKAQPKKRKLGPKLDEDKPKKPVVRRPKKKAVSDSDSDSDEDMFDDKAEKRGKKKQTSDSEEEETRAVSRGRPKKQMKYNFGSSDEGSDMD